MLDQVRIGSKIKEIRIQRNITQEELASTLYVTRQAISRWEQGLALPTVDNIIALSSLLHTSIDEILCLDEPIYIDKEDIFHGHSRSFVVESIINNAVKIDWQDQFYLFNKKERLLLLKAIKDKKIQVDLEEFQYYLNKNEREYLNLDIPRKDDNHVNEY
jgi:transcriptional regulator with XRE-family HTH domain